jgi:hypothetical protein
MGCWEEASTCWVETAASLIHRVQGLNRAPFQVLTSYVLFQNLKTEAEAASETLCLNYKSTVEKPIVKASQNRTAVASVRSSTNVWGNNISVQGVLNEMIRDVQMTATKKEIIRWAKHVDRTG